MVVMVVVFFFLGDLGDQRLGGQQQGRYAGRILQRGADDFRRIDNAGGDHIAIFIFVGVVAVGFTLEMPHAVDDHRAVEAGIVGNRP